MRTKALSVVRYRNSYISPASVYLATLAPSGRNSMYYQLKSAIRILGSKRSVEGFNWGSLNYADMIRIRAQLLDDQKSVHTVNLCLAALKGVAQCAFHLGIMKAEQLLHIKSVKRVPCRTAPTGRSLNTKELRKLFISCKKDTSIRGVRDTALLAVMLSTGLRRAEIASLNLVDYVDTAGILNVARTKGNKARICPLPTITRHLVTKWLAKRGGDEGALFCRIRKNQKLEFKQMTTQAIYDVVHGRAQQASLGKVRPHDLRRTFVTRLLEANIDINTVRQLVGHSDIKTTSRYDLRTPDAKQIVELLL